MEDTKLMFIITSLLIQNTEYSNELLYKVLKDITNRLDGDFDSANPHIRIPRNRTEARKTCLEGKFGIFNNLPCPNDHDVEGPTCMKISDVVAHHLAQGRGTKFTKTPTTDRLQTGIHGCQAMTELLKEMMDI